MSDTRLTIGVDGFSLAETAITSTQAILARKRSGKSYLASVEAEEMLESGHQVLVIDPTGAWHGLRSSADGLSAGYSIAVFGGDHADAPLDYTAGRAMAAAVVEHGFSAIFDVSNMVTDEQIHFVMDFCGELLRLNRTALHLFMDEADTFAPQKTVGNLQNRCLQVVARLVKQGGIRGVGFTMITQRPASMNKDALTQVDMLTVLRMSHPLDIKAAVDWIKSEVSVEFAAHVEKALPRLPVGQAFFCSGSLNMGEHVAVRTRRTFNSGATPAPGERKIAPQVLASIDIAQLGKDIAASVQRAKEDSPEFLRKRIAELEKQIEEAPIGGNAEMELQLKDLMAAAEAQTQELEELRMMVADRPVIAAEIFAFADNLRMLAEKMAGAPSITRFESKVHPSTPNLSDRTVFVRTEEIDIAEAKHRFPSSATEAINAPKQAILNAVATLYASRIADHVSLELIACTAGTTPRSRGFEENMRQLKNAGLVEGLRLTANGAALARADITPARFGAVVDRLKKMISTPQAQMLTIIKEWDGIHLQSVAEKMNTTVRSRGFEENVRQLKKHGLIETQASALHLVSWLRMLPA